MHLWDVISVYSSENPIQPPGTLTHPLPLANSAFGSTGPSSTSSSRLSLTSVDCSLLLTAFFYSLPWNLTFPRLLPVPWEISRASPLCGFRAKTYLGIIWLALTRTHAHRNECTPILPQKKDLKIVQSFTQYFNDDFPFRLLFFLFSSYCWINFHYLLTYI